MPTALAISPHLDDAVFSAGGLLTRYAREGWRVVVATVFTASVPNPAGFALACQLDKGLPADVDYMALRRQEDAAACGEIGATPVWLPFLEAPHRGYRSATDLFAPSHGGDTIVEEIAAAISRLVEVEAPDVVLAPQAVGAHVDHVAVYRALSGYGLATHLWTDFPYAIRPTHRASPFAEEVASCPVARIELDDEELRAKRAAVSCYASQLAFQFGSADVTEAAITSSGNTETFRLKTRTGPEPS